MLVLWGARAGDVQAGSAEDRRRQRFARAGVAFRRYVERGRLIAESESVAADFERHLRNVGRIAGMPASDALANMRANLDRMSVKVGER